MTAWKIPLIVAAIVLPIVGGFALGSSIGVGGSGVGLAVGALVVGRDRRDRRAAAPARPDRLGRRPRTPAATCCSSPPARSKSPAPSRRSPGPPASARRAGDADVLVLSPARIRFLDRWASDVEPAREAAQKNLVATVAALAKAGVEAEARVGDEDVVQAVEDQLQTFPATEVVLVSARRRGPPTRRRAPNWAGASRPSSARSSSDSADVRAGRAAHDLEGAAGDPLQLVEVLVVPARGRCCR